MSDLAHWVSAIASVASAIAAVAAAIAAVTSLGVAKAATKQAKDARRSSVLRELRHTNVSVIVEGRGCLAALDTLRSSNESIAAIAGSGSSPRHMQLQASINGLHASIQSIVDAAVAHRAEANDMYSASTSIIDTALSSAYERLATVRMATDQCARLQGNLDRERLQLLRRSTRADVG